jgi:hypothetical protein
MDLLNGILNGGLGEGTTSSRSGSSAPRSGGTSVITNNTPLTTEEQNARHRGASYSSSGTYERWYIDEETGRKIYTAGDKAGTWEQVQEPKSKSPRSGAPDNNSDYPIGSNAPEAEGEGDDTMLFLLLPVLAILAGKMLKRNKNRKRR